MPQGARHSSVRHLWLGVVLTVLACAFLAPTPVQAGCGDHVTIAPQSQLSTPPAQPIQTPRPCSGPHCQHAPKSLPAPAVPIVVEGHEWACVLEPIVLPSATCTRQPGDEERAQPIFSSSRIYHPPR